MNTTRRTVLLGGAAAGALVAPLAAVSIISNPDADLLTLYADWEQICQATSRSYDEEGDAVDALPGWVRKRTSDLAGHRCILSTNNLPEQDYEAARRQIDELTTPEYRSLIAPLEAVEQRQDDLFGARGAVQVQIADTPAQTVAGVLCKLRLAGYWIRMQHSNRDGVLDKFVPTEGCLALAALADLERLVGEVPS